mmetsp:Transcript_15985/g.27239  ORF Transcript_15985/g.27239 Transcript_15985/m.27239 type:complete len:115 (+) Transcript_15985:216-560(+)
MPKSVLRLVVCGAKRLFVTNDVNNTCRADKVQNFEYGVVHAVVCCDEISISRGEDEEVEFLRPKTDALGVAGREQPPKEDDDGENVACIATQSKYIHTHFLSLFCLIFMDGFAM